MIDRTRVNVAAYESIRNGAPGLSDLTCQAIASAITNKVVLIAGPVVLAPAEREAVGWLQAELIGRDDSEQLGVSVRRLRSILRAPAPSEPVAGEDSGLIDRSLKAAQVLRTMLSVIGQKDGTAVADELISDLEISLRAPATPHGANRAIAQDHEQEDKCHD